MTLDPRARWCRRDAARGDAAQGFGLRFATAPHTEITTKAGRRYARPKDGDEVARRGRRATTATSSSRATRDGHVLHCKADEIAKLEGAGRGVTVIKLDDDDVVIGFIAGRQGRHAARSRPRRAARSSRSRPIRSRSSARGGKGHQLIKRVHARASSPKPVTIQPLANAEGSPEVN